MTKVLTVYEFLRFTEGDRFDPDNWVLAAVRGIDTKTTHVIKLTALDLIDAVKHLPETQRAQVLSGIRSGGSWFYDISITDFQKKIRARCGVRHAKTVDAADLEKVLPVLVEARPFLMFPESFTPRDITDLVTACRKASGPEDYWLFAQRVTECFHPDMNYSDIEKAIRGLLDLYGAAGGVPTLESLPIGPVTSKSIIKAARAAQGLLWEKRPTQLEKDMAAEDAALTEAEHAAGIHTPPLAPEPSPEPTRDYWSTAVALWTLLDEIDTLGDSVKPTDLESYRTVYVKAMNLAEERHKLLKSDGYTLRPPDEPVLRGTHLQPMHFESELLRALKEPTLADALSLVATFENERAVAQAMRQRRDSNTGALWDTTFKHIFTRVLDGWQQEHDLFPAKTALAADTAEALRIARLDLEELRKPVPMLLYCPMCHTKHIDEGEFATRSHHSHACQGFVEVEGKKRRCGHVWRPAIVTTVGVEALPGFINDP